MSQTSHAIVAGNAPNFVPNTTTAPADNPGWNNFSTLGSYVYLGDGWVLSARHVGYNPAAGMQFQTPTGLATFYRIPGDYYQDYGFPWGDTHHYAVSNPATINTTGGPLTLSPFTDLQLFRINGDPGLLINGDPGSPLKIASNPIPGASQILAISGGQGRVAPETRWDVTGSSPNFTWTQTSGPGDQQGYFTDGVVARRWGTNQLANPASASELFSGIVSDTTAVFELPTGVGATARDVISLRTVYDKQPGGTSYEMQAVPGDSGGAVFYKRGSQWELAGIINAQLSFEDQPGGTAVYGNSTIVTDLSYYNQSYPNSIKDIMAKHANYSIMGDVNLDGVVSGNGTGPVTTDDVAAFVAGWGHSSAKGTITSWTKGDLNRDGKTNVLDFFELRDALNGQVSGAVLASLLRGTVVPEPSALLLVILGAMLMASGQRRPRRASQ